MSLTRDLIERVWDLTFQDLTSGDLTAARSLLLDITGVAANGSTTRSAKSMQRFVAANGEGAAPIIGTSLTADPVRAAMANAVAGHSIEYDDVHNASSSHPGVVVFPAAVAAAQLAGADAQRFLLGAAVGYEIMCRVGRAANPPAHYARHFHPTGTAGHLGAAAAAASIMGLGVGDAVSAVGIAATMASGGMEFLADGAWTKRLHPAHAARDGVEAAQLAAEGFRGTKDGIAGDRGFLNAYSGDPNPKELLADWGDRPLEVSATSIKAHTTCRYNQGPIDALLQIRERHDLGPEEVADVRIGLLSVAEDIVWQPVAAKRRPRTVVDAQFSMPYSAAVALRDGRASLGQYDGSLFEDPVVLRLMDATECVVDTGLDLTYPEQWRSWAEVRTTDGRTLRAEIDDPKGDPTNPLTPVELRAKFDDIAALVYTAERRDALAGTIDRLGSGSEMADLLGLLAADR